MGRGGDLFTPKLHPCPRPETPRAPSAAGPAPQSHLQLVPWEAGGGSPGLGVHLGSLGPADGSLNQGWSGCG